MSAPKELQDQIRAIIKPWTDTNQKPNFITQEMVVMCLLLDQPLSKRDVLAKFTDYFGWVRSLAVESMNETVQNLRSSHASTSNERTLRRLGFELQDIRHDFRSPILIHQKPHDAAVYIVKINEARLYLRGHLLPRPSKPFPFMRLPTELRLTIYEMVLHLPKSGVLVSSRGELGTSTVDYNAPSILATARDDFTVRGFSLGESQSQYALLSTNKQVYQEAMPGFSSGNNFIFSGIEAANNLLRGLGSSRVNHVRHISFDWDPIFPAKDVRELFVFLSNMQGLRQIDIESTQNEWEAQVKKKAYNVNGTFLPTKIPGFAKLRKLCTTKQITFYGECDALRAALKPKPAEPGQDKKKRATKRKATDGDQGKDAGTARKAKRAKKAVISTETSTSTGQA